MNILFIGPSNQQDGWNVACKHYIKALATTNCNLTVAPLYTSSPAYQSDPLIQELSRNRFDKYDAVIQNCLPYYFEYDKSFGKNIGLSAFETKNWTNGWQNKIKMMDSLWVPSIANRNMICTPKIDDNVEIVNEPCDPAIYETDYPKISSEITDGKVVFYWIGEYIQRKNLDVVIKAFHTEFHPSEPVELVIKTNMGQHHPDAVLKKVEEDIAEIKRKLALFSTLEDYKSEYIITHRISDEEMYGLHQSCDIFIMPSSGEAWSLPMFDAFGFGNRIISTPTGCYYEIGDEDSYEYQGQYTIQSTYDNIYLEHRPYPDLFTPNEKWLIPNISSLRRGMRREFNMVQENRQKIKRDLSRFSYETVGKKMVKLCK